MRVDIAFPCIYYLHSNVYFAVLPDVPRNKILCLYGNGRFIYYIYTSTHYNIMSNSVYVWYIYMYILAMVYWPAELYSASMSCQCACINITRFFYALLAKCIAFTQYILPQHIYIKYTACTASVKVEHKGLLSTVGVPQAQKVSKVWLAT